MVMARKGYESRRCDFYEMVCTSDLMVIPEHPSFLIAGWE